MPRLALIGQSHAVALLDAIADWRPQLALDSAPARAEFTESFRGWFDVNTGGRAFSMTPRAAYPLFTGMTTCVLTTATFEGELARVEAVDGGRMRFSASDTLRRFIEQAAGAEVIVSVLYGSEPFRASLAQTMPDYDFFPFDEPPSGQPIDRIHIGNVLNQFCALVSAPLACIRMAFPKAHILHIAPPPPLRNLLEAGVREGQGELLESHGVVRASLRRKWHRGYVDVLRAQLAQVGVELLKVDNDSVSEDGYLRPEFAEGLSHGNRRYGEMLAECIRRRIERGA